MKGLRLFVYILQCQGITLCSPIAAQLCTSCLRAARSQAARLESSLGSHGDCYTPPASLAPGLHREQALALVRSEPLPLLFRIQPSNSSSEQFPWLSLTCHCINWLQSLSIQNFCPIKTKTWCFLAEALILQPLYLWHSH